MSAYSHDFSEAAPPHRPLELPRLRQQSSPLTAQAGERTVQQIYPPPFGASSLTAEDRAGEPATCTLPPMPPLPGTGAGGSISAVLQCRLEQIEKWGHTPEQDLARPLADFGRDMWAYMKSVREDFDCHAPLATLRKHLVKLAALILATIDRIDAELEQ